MTREEAINNIKELQDTYIKCRGEEDAIEVLIDSVDIEAFDVAIKALEQEPILEKIRAQFKSHLRGVEITLEVLGENDPLRPKFEGAKETLEECLEIIDKAESEDKENDQDN